jgi:predicted SprT family Zn-dependent metalloprotease
MPHDETMVEYDAFQIAFTHFNSELFGGRLLPDTLITLNRKPHSYGHFSANKLITRGGALRRQELSLNPDHFVGRTDEEIMSTLVHEMTHDWQYQLGAPGARSYHNKEWAAKMKTIGLYPSNSGAAGGRETGQRMSHYIMRPGPFAESFARLAATGWRLNLESTPRPEDSNGTRKDKPKYTCAACRLNAWGKPRIRLACVECLIAGLDEAGFEPQALQMVNDILADGAEMLQEQQEQQPQPSQPQTSDELIVRSTGVN